MSQRTAHARQERIYAAGGPTLVYLSGLGAGGGSFMCWVFRYLLPGKEFDYGKWAGVGAAIGFGVGLVRLIGDVLLY